VSPVIHTLIVPYTSRKALSNACLALVAQVAKLAQLLPEESRYTVKEWTQISVPAQWAPTRCALPGSDGTPAAASSSSYSPAAAASAGTHRIVTAFSRLPR